MHVSDNWIFETQPAQIRKPILTTHLVHCRVVIYLSCLINDNTLARNRAGQRNETSVPLGRTRAAERNAKQFSTGTPRHFHKHFPASAAQ